MSKMTEKYIRETNGETKKDKNKAVLEYILKIVLQKDLKIIDFCEESYIVNFFEKKIVFLVEAIDSEGLHYDIEMQETTDGKSIKGETDDNSLPYEHKAKNHLEKYFIFFTEKDIFEMDLPIYQPRRIIYEHSTNDFFEDNRHFIYINYEYLKNHPVPQNEIEKLIHDLQCENISEIYSKEIKNYLNAKAE